MSSRSASPAPGSLTSYLPASLPASLSSALSWTLRRISPDDESSHAPRSRHHSPDARQPLPRRRQPSPYAPPPLTPIKLTNFSPSTSLLLSRGVAEEIRVLLPDRLQLHEEWSLTYSLEEHGVSLATLYALQTTDAYVLVVKDSLGGVFGAFVNEQFRPCGRYYGNGECFLWKAAMVSTKPVDLVHRGLHLTPGGGGATETIRFKAFPYSGVNDYVIFSDHTFLSLGGGDGHYGLWLDDNFDRGVSAGCPTFGNEPLSEEGTKFDILGVELWRIGPARN